MTAFIRVISYVFLAALLLTGCAQKFYSLDCAAPTATPSVTQRTIDNFARQNIILMPKGNYLRIILPADLFFRTNSAALKNNTGSALADLAQLLQGYGNTATVQIKGYTDPVASNEEKKMLSVARARTIAASLWAQGLDANHLYAVGYGDSSLVGDPNDVSANAANRRVEITVQAHCTACF